MSRLRTAGPEDGPLVERLFHQAVVWRPGEETPTLEELLAEPRLAAYVVDFGRKEDYGVIAEENGRPVGGGWWRHFSAQLPGYGFVSEDVPELALAVFAAQRGRGIGTALLEDLIREATARELPGLSLSVARDNPALALYQRLGFSVASAETEPLTMLRPRS